MRKVALHPVYKPRDHPRAHALPCGGTCRTKRRELAKEAWNANHPATMELDPAEESVVHHEEKKWVSQVGYEALEDGHTVFVPQHESEYAAWLARDALRHLNELE